MAGNMTNAFEGVIIDHLFRNQAWVPPTTCFVGLYTVVPTDSTTGTEVTGGDYGRQAITFTASGGAGATANNADITFPVATADWGTVVAAAVLSGTTGGTMMMYGTLLANKVVSNGDTFKFNSGEFDLVFD